MEEKIPRILDERFRVLFLNNLSKKTLLIVLRIYQNVGNNKLSLQTLQNLPR